jgi:hypothetical protein
MIILLLSWVALTLLMLRFLRFTKMNEWETLESTAMSYLVTEEQLLELQVLVWGARMTNEGEPERFEALIQEIKRQPLQ